MRRSATTTGLLLAAIAACASACAGAREGAVGAACTAADDCADRVCLASRCADPAGDEDDDGVTNRDELRLGLDPLDFDTDHDGTPDGDEVGDDPLHPRDTDGDGRIDALESSVEDADGDCLPDASDPHDRVPDATPAQIAAARCSRRGVCGSGTDAVRAACVEGRPACDYTAVPGYQEEETRCDGLDNDCDGRTDEGFALLGVAVGLPCQGAGTCGAGVVECAGDGMSTRCSSSPGGSQDGSAPEVCDGLDNDCDGGTDEDVSWRGSAVGGPCRGDGECGEGVVYCRPDRQPDCSSQPGGPDDASQPETCNGKDDDCDGETDEDVVVSGSPMDVCRPVGVCAAHADKAALVCAEGQPACDWSQVPGWSPLREQACNGLDGDCDGRTDEDFTWRDPVLGPSGVGQPCGVGVCAGGRVECAPDGLSATCSTLVKASAETCNQVDDDCDGAVDDGLYKVWAAAGLEATAGVPPPRAWTAAAYVPAGAGLPGPGPSLYTYGGVATATPNGAVLAALADFWRYDLASHRFVRVSPSCGPGPRAGAALLHDPSDGRLLLVGGVPGAAEPDGPVWEYRPEGGWKALGVTAPQAGPIAASLDVGGGRLVAIRTDLADGAAMTVVHLHAGVSTPVPLSLPYRRDPAWAGRADGTLFVSGGFNAGGVPTRDLFAVTPEGTVTAVALSPDLPPRARHGLAALPDGSLLLYGGLEKAGAGPAAGGFRIWPADGRVEAVPAVAPPALQMPALCAAGEDVFLLSGMDLDGRGFRDVLRFAPSAGQWIQDLLEVVPPARAGGVMAVVPSRRAAYLVGGFARDLVAPVAERDVWSLSLDEGSFSRVLVMGKQPLFVRGAAAVETSVATVVETKVVDGVEVQIEREVDASAVYLHGGLDGPPGSGKAVETLSRLLPADGSVDPIPAAPGPTPAARSDHAMAWTGTPGNFLLHGGRDGDKVLGDVWRVEVSKSVAAWKKLSAPDRPRYGHAAAWDASRKRLLVAGGLPQGDLSAFDPSTGAWTVLATHDLLVADGGAAFLDADSRHLLYLPPGGGGEALVLGLREDGGADAATVHLQVPPVFPGPLAAFDPFGRQAMLFGGTSADGATASSLWLLPEVCPQ